MPNVMIIDEDRSASACLKLYLSRRRHRVTRGIDIREAVEPVDGFKPDLVLIRLAPESDSGWEAFNRFKQIAPGLPVMVYALESLTAVSIDWIGKAVEAAIEEMGRRGPPALVGVRPRDHDNLIRHAEPKILPRLPITSPAKPATPPAAGMAC